MGEPITFRYRAFLSYSHADTRAAKRLHRAIEGFRIDRDLAGRQTSQGPIPRTLRPVFRDRDDFTAGHTLTDQTTAALDASAALIVLCSPASARSHYVNEEVRLFKSRYPERPVVPVIIDGVPGDAERECFALALRREVAADGTITDKPIEELAADVRETGDGYPLALAKVVARLLDLTTDEVFRRAERARRRAANIRHAIIGALAALAIVATGSAAYAWQQLKTNEAFLEATLKRATDIVNTAVEQAQKYNVPRTATLELLTRAEGLFDDMARLGRPTATLQLQRARMLLQFARNYGIIGNTDKQRERSDEALRIMVALAQQNPDDPALMVELTASYVERGRVFHEQGNLDEARQSLLAGIATAERTGGRLAPAYLSNTYARLGDVQRTQGHLEGALKSYRAAYAIAQDMAKTRPNSVLTLRTQNGALSGIAEVLYQQGDLSGALRTMRACLGVAERIAKALPADNGSQASLGYYHGRIGGLLLEQGDPAAALRSYETSLAIREQVAKADPTNATSQRELAFAYNSLGNGHFAGENYAAALKAHQASLAIRQKLAAADPTNARRQRDVTIAHGSIGSVLATQGDFAGALASYQEGLTARQRLSASDPGNALWQRDVSIALNQIGDVRRRQGDVTSALDSYLASFAIRERLSASDSQNANWRRDMAQSYGKIGLARFWQGKPAEALADFRKSLAVREQIAKAAAGHPRAQHDLAVGHYRLAAAYRESGDIALARDTLALGQAIMQKLVAAAPGSSRWKRELATYDAPMSRESDPEDDLTE